MKGRSEHTKEDSATSACEGMAHKARCRMFGKWRTRTVRVRNTDRFLSPDDWAKHKFHISVRQMNAYRAQGPRDQSPRKPESESESVTITELVLYITRAVPELDRSVPKRSLNLNRTVIYPKAILSTRRSHISFRPLSTSMVSFL